MLKDLCLFVMASSTKLTDFSSSQKAVTSTVNFVCQRCYQPLKLDSSFENVDNRLHADLISPVTILPKDDITESEPDQDPALKCDENDARHRFIPPARLLSTESGNDFTLLGESEPSHGESLSHRLRVTSELFDILSGQSEIDHPLCEECTDNLLDMLDQQLRITEDECKDYQVFLEDLEKKKGGDVDEEKYDSELKALYEEEMALRQQLNSIENEHNQVKEQTLRETEKSKHLDAEEEKYFKQYNEYKRQLLEYEDAQRSVDNQLRYAQTQLEKLKKTNVFNATFHIWHSGHFGTINGFRLGRLPNEPVEWNEINAAWGQTVLLLHSLANKMSLKFERYKLVPYGNHSYIESLGDKTKELPLHGSGGIKFFWDTKFDQAMVAFLDCLQQFKEAVEKGDTGFSLPYKMEKGRIEDGSTGSGFSIKTQFNSEEQWTKALKFMLTNLKWGLAWVSSQFATK